MPLEGLCDPLWTLDLSKIADPKRCIIWRQGVQQPTGPRALGSAHGGTNALPEGSSSRGAEARAASGAARLSSVARRCEVPRAPARRAGRDPVQSGGSREDEQRDLDPRLAGSLEPWRVIYVIYVI